MKKVILTTAILMFFAKFLDAQYITFSPQETLFNLESSHYELNQPLIPYKSAEGKYNFIGRSGQDYYQYEKEVDNKYKKNLLPGSDFFGSIIDRLDLDNDGDADIITEFGVYKNTNNDFVDQFLQLTMKGAADFNNDGLLDLIAEKEITFEKDILYLLINKGNFVFDKILLEEGIDEYETFAAGDIDNDGNIDFAISTKNYVNKPVKLFFNKGNLTFEIKAKYYEKDIWTMSLELYDFDNDKDLDMVMENNSYGIYIFENTDNFNTFTHKDIQNIQYVTMPLIVKPTDFNNDGFTDLAILSQTQDNLYFLTAQGTGNFEFNLPTFATMPLLGGILVGTFDGTAVSKNLNLLDYDNDGKMDVVITSGFDKKQLLLTNNTLLSGINTTPIDESVNLYPSITSSNVTITSDEIISTIIIFDTDGKIIEKLSNINSTQLTIMLKKRGVNFVEVTTKKGTKTVKAIKE